MKKLIAACLIIACSVFSVFAGGAGEGGGAPEVFPSREVSIIVGNGPGGGLDNFSRAIAPPAADKLGKPVVVQNMQGGGGSVALTYLQEQPADGYNVYAISLDLVLNDLFEKCEYTRNDLIPILRAQHDQGLFWVAKNSKYKTLKELTDYAKANPGKLTFGLGATLNIDLIVAEQWAALAGIEIKCVPLANGGEMTAALMGGHVDVVHEEPSSAMDLYKAGEIIPLVVLTENRLSEFPDVPTARELGLDLTVANWRGLFVKKGTPPDVITKLHDAFKGALEDPKYKQIEHDSLLDLRPGYLNSGDFSAFIEDQYLMSQKILRNVGMLK